MQNVVKIGDLSYVFLFDGNEFSFYVKSTAYVNDDLSSFYDDDKVAIIKSGDEVTTDHPVTLYRHLMKFFDSVLSTEKPHYFFFSANESKKISLYAKVAAIVSNKFGYHFEQSNKTFYFYKQI